MLLNFKNTKVLSALILLSLIGHCSVYAEIEKSGQDAHDQIQAYQRDLQLNLFLLSNFPESELHLLKKFCDYGGVIDSNIADSVVKKILGSNRVNLREALTWAFKLESPELVAKIFETNDDCLIGHTKYRLIRACEEADAKMISFLLKIGKINGDISFDLGTCLQVVGVRKPKNKEAIEDIVMMLIQNDIGNEMLINVLPKLIEKVSSDSICVKSIYEKILESGKDLDKVLELAVKSGLYDFVSHFISAIDNNGATLLHYACSYADKAMISDLLDSDKFDVNALTDNNLSPIMLIALNDMEDNDNNLCEIAKLLIEKGAALDIMGPDGRLLHEIALEAGNFELSQLLKDKMPIN